MRENALEPNGEIADQAVLPPGSAGSEGSVPKLATSKLNLKINKFAMEILHIKLLRVDWCI
jgi:hypothetical protein